MSEQRIRVWLLNPPPDRASFQLQWIDPGTGLRVTRSARTADPERAEAARGDKEYELNNGIARGDGTGPAGWPEVRAAYGADRVDRMKPATRAVRHSAFLRWEGAVGPDAPIDARAVSRYAASLSADGLAPGTAASYLSAVRTMLRWAAEVGMIPAAPKVPIPRVPRRAISHTDAAGLAKLAKAAPCPAWRLYLSVLWYTGMRQSEAAALSWAPAAESGGPVPWIDMGARRIVIPGGTGKDEDDSWLPIHPALMAALKKVPAGRRTGRLLPGLPATEDARGQAFKRIAKRAGVRLTLHGLRRSFATRLAPYVPAQTLQRLMRHKDIRTTLRYYVDADRGLDEAIRKG